MVAPTYDALKLPAHVKTILVTGAGGQLIKVDTLMIRFSPYNADIEERFCRATARETLTRTPSYSEAHHHRHCSATQSRSDGQQPSQVSQS